MDASKYRELLATIEIEDDVAMGLSLLSDQTLASMASQVVLEIILGSAKPTFSLNAALGAFISIGHEAAERAVVREKERGE